MTKGKSSFRDEGWFVGATAAAAGATAATSYAAPMPGPATPPTNPLLSNSTTFSGLFWALGIVALLRL